MKKIFSMISIVIILLVVAVMFNLIWSNYLTPLEIPELLSLNNEFGSIIRNEENTNLYEIYSQKLSSEEFIDSEVNSYIDSMIDSSKNVSSIQSRIPNRDKAAFKNVIDTYKINENLISIKVTTIAKKLYEDNYTTTVKAFNYNLETKKNIALDELFKSSYKEKIKDIYSDNYLLGKNHIEFYNDNIKNTCTYNSLKEYSSSKILTAQNYEISQEEYDNMFSKVIDKTKKMVAITLDDGPHSVHTKEILDILQDHNAKATFFMLGQNIVNNRDIVKDVYDRGNEIGIHTWSHKQLTKLSKDEIISEIKRTSDEIQDITGQRPNLVRPPYGSLNDRVKSAVEYTFILWNIDSLDWKSRDENKIVPLVMDNVQDGDIILLHDIHSTTIPAVEKIVNQLEILDYQMVTVSELLESKGYDTTKTKVFYSGRQ